MLVAASVEWASSLPQVLGHGQHKRPGPEESNKAHCRGETLALTRIAVRLLIASMAPRGVCCSSRPAVALRLNSPDTFK